MELDNDRSLYFGNAALDEVRDTGWFIGQFVPAELGLRHQTEVELKWGIHQDGERRRYPYAQGHATTVAILIRGALLVEFYSGPRLQVVTLQKEGDSVIYRPAIVHSWEGTRDTLVLTVPLPSVKSKRPTPLSRSL